MSYQNLPNFLRLIWHLTHRDFRLRYKGSILGIAWSVLLPLIHLSLLVFIFSGVIPLNIENYSAFVFTALLPWTWFSNSVSAAGNIFISNRDLVRRPNFSPWILMLVNTFSNLILYLVALPLLIMLLMMYHLDISWPVLNFPVLLLIQASLIIGLGLFIATLNVFYRDIQHLTNVGLLLLFYITPVFYSSQRIKSNYQYLYKLNPLSVLIQSYRSIFFYGRPPDWSDLLVTCFISLAILIIGFAYSRRRLNAVIDMV
jgi:homopolymeric O-antigen transport system permease protein